MTRRTGNDVSGVWLSWSTCVDSFVFTFSCLAVFGAPGPPERWFASGSRGAQDRTLDESSNAISSPSHTPKMKNQVGQPSSNPSRHFCRHEDRQTQNQETTIHAGGPDIGPGRSIQIRSRPARNRRKAAGIPGGAALEFVAALQKSHETMNIPTKSNADHTPTMINLDLGSQPASTAQCPSLTPFRSGVPKTG